MNVKPFPTRDMLVQTCKVHLESKHCTLWRDWIIESDKTMPDGTVQKRGLTLASEWLADEIITVVALTGVATS